MGSNTKGKQKVSIFALSMGSGGAEKVISILLKKLSLDYDVSLFLMFNVFHHPVPANVKVILASERPILTVFQKIILMPKVFFKYSRFLKQNNIDVSISFLSIPNLISGLLKVFNNEVKVVISERAFPSIEYRSSKLRFYIYRIIIPWLYNKVDVVFSNSKWINKDLKENFGVKKEMKVVYNPIIFPANYKKFDIDSFQRLKLINVGRIYETKNQRLIIDSLGNLPAELEFTMTFLGEGRMRKELEDLVSSKQMGNRISFLGNVHNVNDFLIDCDCYILSSNSEGFPNSLIEAMAIGLPVISTNCKSGPLEILNDDEFAEIPRGSFFLAKYGILINVGDNIGLSKAIEYLASDRRILNEFSIKSRKRAQDFELDNIYKDFKKLIIES